MNNKIGLSNLLWDYTWERTTLGRLCWGDVLSRIEGWIGICLAPNQPTNKKAEGGPPMWLNRTSEGAGLSPEGARLGNVVHGLVLPAPGCMFHRIRHFADVILRSLCGYGNHLLKSALCRPLIIFALQCGILEDHYSSYESILCSWVRLWTLESSCLLPLNGK